MKNEIEIKRLANLIIYFVNNTENCGAVKINKLLYYLDCNHLRKYGRKVLKDTYKKFPEGPVPVDIWNRIKSLAEIKEFSDFDEPLSEYIDVEMKDIGDYCFREIIPKKEFDDKWFSISEREIMKEVAERFKYSSAKELSNLTHKELPYREAWNYEEIDLKLYLKDKLSEEEIKEIAFIEKEIEALDYNYS